MKTVRKIDSTNSLISTELFPLVSGVQKKSNHHFALIGIGGNIGDSTRRFAHLIHYLRRVPFVSIVETSPIVKNPPFGYLEQPYFFNALISIYTTLMPHQLLRYINNIERVFGRKRSFADAPRTLDIDIIMYENKKIETTKLTIPHMSWFERDSVLLPLSKMRGVR